MKRSAELTPLSHDHHQALYVALQLKRGAEGAATALLSFFDADGGRHFRIEEEILLPAWIAGDPGADVGMAARVVTEHVELRAGIRRIRAGRSTQPELHELGAALDRHIRFEERELFAMIEAGLGAEAMGELGAEIERAERGA